MGLSASDELLSNTFVPKQKFTSLVAVTIGAFAGAFALTVNLGT